MAPEIHKGEQYDGKAVDVFAAAIILFVILTQRPPFEVGSEDNVHYQLISAGGQDAELFWQAHAEATEDGSDIYSTEFKDLFQRMMARDPAERLTVDQVLNHAWFSGPVTSHAAIKQDFDSRKQIVDKNAHDEREERRTKRKNPGTRRGREAGEDGTDFDVTQLDELEIEDYDMHTNKTTKFFTTADPRKFMTHLIHHLDAKKVDFKVSDSSLKIKFDTKLYPVPDEDSDEGVEEKVDDSQAEVVKCTVRVFKCTEEDEKNNGKSCIDFSYNDIKTKKNLVRDERCPFNFRDFIEDDVLKNYHDSSYE